MPKYAQLVMGPAGSGKSTYCAMMQEHLNMMKRQSFVVNCDPAAEHFSYEVSTDIRDIIELEDVMNDDELHLGPNGGLIFCMEYIVKHMDQLFDQLDEREGDYFIFDFPGQIELYTHLPVMRQFVDALQHRDFRVCGVFLVDAQFLGEPSKFISGIMAAQSCMINLEISHISVMSKLDMLPQSSKRNLEKYLETEDLWLLCEQQEKISRKGKFAKLTKTICQLIEDYGLVSFMPLDRSEKNTLDNILNNIDMIVQYDEDREVQTRDEEIEDGDE